MKLILLSLLFAAHAQAADVVASFSILGDWARKVAPNGVDVAVLAGEGVDPHTFEPRPSDLKTLKQAKLVLRIGLGFESWLDRALKASEGKARVITIADALEITKRKDKRAADPHLWQDPDLALKAIDAIKDAFKAEYPAKAGEIEVKADVARKSISSVRDELKKQFAEIPAAHRVVVTSHDGFGYFAQAFGLEILPAQGWSTETDPSAKQIAALIRQIREKKARALFVEKQANPKVIQQISRETDVQIGGELYGDTLSGPKGPARDYEALLRHNALQFLRAIH